MKLHPICAAITVLMAAAAPLAQADDVRRPYIVQLADKPVASYSGGVSGLAATQPAAGQRLDLDSTAVSLYSDYLVKKQESVKATVAAAPVIYEYKVALNGFTALLTDAEVRTLQANSGVASISADEPRQLVTNYTPTFLGLDGPNGLWAQLGGKSKAGENIIVGIIDGGIWPENPSYADRVANDVPTFDQSAALNYTAPPAKWKGTCQVGQGFTVANCNNKLIGARYFKQGFDQTTNTLHWSDFISPRDSIGGTLGHGGHGTHTSSTAAGNNNVPATLSGIGMGNVSGMAPRARVAMYKVCWTYNDATDATGGKNSCWASDSAAAIEQAIIDGVDVLNYSISGGTTVNDPVEQAFLHAANAGVFVAASAGNDGPDNQVNHIGPWLTTVAASTHNRFLKGDVGLGNGATYSGASLNVNALPATAIIRSEDAVAAGASASAAQLCYSKGTNGGAWALDPDKVAGKVVTCLRGTNARVDKSLAVLEAGGVGMVMVDNGGGLVAEIHSVPTVHVSAADGALIKTYAASSGATASLSHFVNSVGSVAAPVIADFSSRGPNRVDGNTLKPDVTAPGVDILAGVTPELTPAQQAEVNSGTLVPPAAWNLYQGTSMSSPHVAGVAALLRQQHTGWSPAAIKSALMTSATPTFPDAQSGNLRGILPFAQGAGHINPFGTVIHPADGKAYNSAGASDPGLVYDLGATDYKKYLCGAGVTAECSGVTAIQGQALNLPSITLNNVLGTTSVTRSVTNVGTSAATYSGKATLSGYTTTLSPATLTLEPGQTKTYTVSLTRSTAADNVWQFGDVTWTDSSHVVRIPLTARSGKPVTAPAGVYSTKATGNSLLTVTTGFAGRMNSATGGLKPITKGSLQNVAQIVTPPETVAQLQTACNGNTAGAKVIPFTFPANTVAASFELFDSDTSSGDGSDDLDLYLLDSTGALVGSSGTGGSNEAILLNAPAAGNYKLCVIGYAAADGLSTNFNLSSVVVSRTDTGGSLKAMLPSQVYAGGTATVGATWSGLASGQRYLGGIQFLDTSGATAATTVLLIETNSPVPLARGAAHTTKRNSAL
ncbi:S8 family serine peptidase [Duganella sp. FT80W]|uniref:S8 family serine peptidase n=1 Tax=Duganella guangzhouensis TaxID=2666084 RepID=A0A6I2L5I0_9BURK|nr:S8 family serine peptidase [Duganella guangzhouensis]MRW93053.1 S8 family serine peptidase [Duganella guangzhouensis]